MKAVVGGLAGVALAVLLFGVGYAVGREEQPQTGRYQGVEVDVAYAKGGEVQQESSMGMLDTATGDFYVLLAGDDIPTAEGRVAVWIPFAGFKEESTP